MTERTARRWSAAAIAGVLQEAEYLKTCPTGDPWSAIHMKARMEDLIEIVKQLQGKRGSNERS